MSLLDSHTATFHRYVRGPKDSLGNSNSVTEVSGFPVSVAGLFEFSKGRSSQRDEGIRSVRQAKFRSYSYLDGRVGDYVEFNGATYVVTEIDDNRHVVGVPHFAYYLEREELGNRVKFNKSDASRVNPGE